MDSAKDGARPALGFVTVVEHPQHGFFGGYLLLNLSARPIEFHCTAPVKPNRAQQILYGPTLEPFLYGEQIGLTLLEHAKTRPLVVCTDRPPMLALRELADIPVALVVTETDDKPAQPTESLVRQPDGTDRTLRIDQRHPSPRLLTFELGRNRLAISQRMASDREAIIERLSESLAEFDLSEPFTRIREAIEEAQQSVR